MAFEKEQLFKALWQSGVSEVPSGAFAFGGEIDGTAHCLPNFLSVEGLGQLPLPLSYEHGFKLREMADLQPTTYTSWNLQSSFVSRAWGLGAAKLGCPDNEEFLCKTVPEIASQFVRGLGEDPDALQLKTKLLHLLFFEQGGSIRFDGHREFVEPGRFGWLFLKVPTTTGHETGALVISQDGTTKLFDNSEKSSSNWYATSFFEGCDYKLEKLAKGMRLCLVFSLVRKNSSRLSLLQVPGFLDAVVKTEEALRPWVEALKDERTVLHSPQVLAVVLGHTYVETYLSFTELKDNDWVVVKLLRQCGERGNNADLSLEVQLCRLMKRQVFSNDKFQYQEVECTDWVGIDDKPGICIHVNLKSELVKAGGQEDKNEVEEEEDEEEDEEESEEEDQDKDMEDEDSDGFEEDTCIEYDSRENRVPRSPIWSKWNKRTDSDSDSDNEQTKTYHLALVVVFPKLCNTQVACRAGFSGALDWVDSKLQNGAPDAIDYLKELLDFYSKQLGHLMEEWETRDRCRNGNRNAREEIDSQRLLKVCLKIGHYRHVKSAINLLGQTFDSPAHSERTWHLGLSGGKVANALALVVQAYGKKARLAIQQKLLCASWVLDEAEYYAAFVMRLHFLGYHKAATSAGKATYDLVSSYIDVLKVPGLVAAARMVFLCTPEQIPAFLQIVQSVQGLGTKEIFAVVLKLHSAACAKTIRLEGDPHFCSLCQVLATRDLPASSSACADQHVPSAARVIKNLLWLENGPVLEAGVQALVNQSRQAMTDQTLLKEVLGNELVWQQAAMTSIGRQALLRMAQEYIRKLSTPLPAPSGLENSGPAFERKTQLESLQRRIQDIREPPEEQAAAKRLKASEA